MTSVSFSTGFKYYYGKTQNVFADSLLSLNIVLVLYWYHVSFTCHVTCCCCCRRRLFKSPGGQRYSEVAQNHVDAIGLNDVYGQ